jgi:hypothetical protein
MHVCALFKCVAVPVLEKGLTSVSERKRKGKDASGCIPGMGKERGGDNDVAYRAYFFLSVENSKKRTLFIKSAKGKQAREHSVLTPAFKMRKPEEFSFC